jgi:hypothetical protein
MRRRVARPALGLMAPASFVVVGAVLLGACSGGDSLPTGPSPVTAELDFRYVLRDAASAATATCAGRLRIDPSFWGFAHVSMMPLDDGTWSARFLDVPVGRHSIRLEAPPECAEGVLFVNGVRLTESGVASFSVSASGQVTR